MLDAELLPKASEDAPSTPTCTFCKHEQSLRKHQPDPQWPSRILGDCSSCGAWFIVHRDGTLAVLILWNEDGSGSGEDSAAC